MKHYFLVIGAIMLLVGVGCSNATPANNTDTMPSAKDAGDTTMDESSMMEDELIGNDNTATGDITLTAEPRNDGAVYFNWELPAQTEYDGFILVRSEEVNPEHTGKNYWFRQHYTRRAVTWTPLPKGEWNFRICGLDGNECAVYSNNVTATIR